MGLSQKNLKDIKTSVIGLLLIAIAVYYLFVLEKESYTIFFGTLLLGIIFLLAPDKALTNINLFFKRFLKGFGSEQPQDDKPNIDIDIQTENKDSQDIPNER